MYCIIMGDIINSREMDSDTREKVLQTAKETFDSINAKHLPSLMAGFGLVRGDAFEGILLTPYQAPRIIQNIIKSFYLADKTKLRIVMVLGNLTTTGIDRNEADGPAFHRALDILDSIKENKSSHWLQVAFDTNSFGQPIVESGLELLSALTEKWTERQREIVWAMEKYFEQQHLVGKQLHISPSVVNKQLKAANYQTYRRAWQNLESYLINLEESIVMDKIEQEKGYTAFFSTGRRRMEQGKYIEALPLLKRSLELAKSELGDTDPQLISIYNQLADVQMSLNSHEDAEKSLMESLCLQKSLPKARLEYAKTFTGLGDLSLLNKDYDEAIAHYNNALEVCFHTVDDTHPFIGTCYMKLADAYFYNNDFLNSLKYYEKSKGIQNMQTNPLEYVQTIMAISNCYINLGNTDKAISFGQEFLQICNERIPAKHPSMLRIKAYADRIYNFGKNGED